MKRTLAVCAGAVLAATAAGAESYKVQRSLDLTDADMAWKIMGDFCDIDDWHPAVEVCRLRVIDGALHRVLTLAGGGEFVEKRIAEEPGISYSYTIESAPLPVEKYVATMAITRGDAPVLTWSGSFQSDDPEMEAVFGGIYDAGLAGIAEMLGH
jgi:hypothetical protein